VKAHLTLCRECAEVFEDFSKILGICDLEIAEEIPPPNEQALWCRINNIIENEIKPELNEEFKQKDAPPASWMGRIWQRSWSLSFTQVASAVLGIALVSSLLTIVGIQNAVSPSSLSAAGATQPTLFEKVVSKIGLAEDPQELRERRFREQQAAIDYWNKRVAARRIQWDKNLRDAFDRNLQEIDQVVFEYTRTLEENPHDELSGEMLDSALDEKMALLREFSEL
jgi:hypothetical protein